MKQSYEDWDKDTDEMDVDKDGCISFYVIILWFIAIILLSILK